MLGIECQLLFGGAKVLVVDLPLSASQELQESHLKRYRMREEQYG